MFLQNMSFSTLHKRSFFTKLFFWTPLWTYFLHLIWSKAMKYNFQQHVRMSSWRKPFAANIIFADVSDRENLQPNLQIHTLWFLRHKALRRQQVYDNVLSNRIIQHWKSEDEYERPRRSRGLLSSSQDFLHVYWMMLFKSTFWYLFPSIAVWNRNSNCNINLTWKNWTRISS